ncbi:hypothetical protein AM593_08619, partial [Mytilus galloprovincialis]
MFCQIQMFSMVENPIKEQACSQDFLATNCDVSYFRPHCGMYYYAGTNIGVTYVRWGKKTCPENSEIVYTGQAGGNYYKNKGGGSNYLCLPRDPENGKAYSYGNNVLYGAEYEIHSSTKPSGLPASLREKEVPCAVCRRRGKVSVLMIPGKKSCYKGWKSEYSGFLMSEYIGHNIKDYICMDGEAETLDNRSSNEEGALFYPVRAKCGSLRCPPYKDNTEVLCTNTLTQTEAEA